MPDPCRRRRSPCARTTSRCCGREPGWDDRPAGDVLREFYDLVAEAHVHDAYTRAEDTLQVIVKRAGDLEVRHLLKRAIPVHSASSWTPTAASAGGPRRRTARGSPTSRARRTSGSKPPPSTDALEQAPE